MNEHFKDANSWIKCAQYILDENPRVSAAMSAHAMIKSLDALFEEKFSRTPQRHDKATDFFKEVLSRNLIRGEESRFLHTIQNILQKKSSAEYHTSYYSKDDARQWIRNVENIMEMCGKYV
ncbi:MAG: HEPN domain-containing protein [Candidatus Aenigmarchaeota archaeon]|nr:HEPN domain-containing protein [Candidatus Aenigmarchaeota archaeon]